MKTMSPLSKVQFGLYVECVAHQGEACYNLPYLYVLDGSLDEEKLKTAIETAVKAHPTLFTRIELNEQGDPLQTIDDTETFTLNIEHGTLNIENGTFNDQSLIVPFDIYNDRLFHIRLLKDADHFYFFLDIHHIIGDGTTLKVMLSDVDKVYGGGTLEPEAMTMAEVAIAEAELRKTSAFEEGKQWYAQNFDCGDCFTQLMPDLEEPEHSEASMVRTLDVEMAEVDAFCKEKGIFKSNFFTTVYSFLLAKYNNEQESLFTTIYNGRTDKRFLHSVGMTVKTLPVYAKFDNETKVLDYLKAGQDQMSGVRQHEAYAFSDALNDLGLQSNSMFAWHGMMFADEQLCGKPMKTIRLCNSTLEASLYLKAFILNGKYQVKAEYNSNEYSQQLISQYLESYEAVVKGFLKEEYLRDVNITTENQIEVLDSFNQNDVDYDDTQTIVSLFRRQAKATPENIAVVYQDKRFTYAEVDDISDRIAGYIAAKGLGLEDVVSVLIPRSEWMPIASLGVMKAGCAYQPLDPSYPKERLNFMMQDASAKLLIADEELRPIVDEYQGDVLLTKELMGLPAVPQMPAEPKPDNMYIMLYTSGSTGVPKGCQLIHRNMVAFIHWYHRYYDLKAEHKVAAYASYGFDACMMDMYPALTCGATLHIVPEELRLDLVALNEYFEREHITNSFMTTQVAYQFATNIESHSLNYLSTGGEKLAGLTPPKSYKLVNVYGPTETTVLVTFYPVEHKQQNIPIGKAIDNMHLYIVDPQGHRLPIGAAGELWISGPQVSRGYLNRPEKTAEVYIGNPFTTDEKYARVYRTGDIVRYLPDGNISFVGRRDGQVKIRGFRIELKEIEGVIREFPGIKDATVQAFDEEGGNGKFIAAYIVSDEQVDIEALNNFILDQKPPYMVPAVTMQIDAIPLNQNQKVNKKALPKPEKKAAVVEESNVPMNVLEQELHEMIAGIVNNTEFGITTVLGYAGLTSISAIKLAVQVNKRYGVTLDSKSLVKTGTLQSIENEIIASMMKMRNGENEEMRNDHAQSMSQSLNVSFSQCPLSYAQMGVYVECMKNPTSTVYNIPVKVAFPKTTDTQDMADALRSLVKLHPQLTVHFGNEGSETVQIVDTDQKVEIAISNLSEAELEHYKHEFVRPFNLNRGPLYHFEIVTTEQQVYLLMDVHHLVFDGASMDLFLSQLCAKLNGEALDAEDLSYANFVMEEKKAESGEAFAAASAWFQESLGTLEGVTEIPADLTNPIEQGTVSLATSPFDMAAVDSFCRANHITPAHLTLAAVFYTLSRFSNNERLCITTISNGRSNLRIHNTIGMFVNTLALSAQIGHQTVQEFLQEVSENFDKTLAYENYPFAKIAADYDLSAEIMFAYQMGVVSQYTCQGKELELENLELNVPKFRVAFYIKEYQGVPSVWIEYDNGRYSQGLMQSLADSVSLAVQAFISNPKALLTGVSLIDSKQLSVLDDFNQNDVDYDAAQTVISLFRQQVAQHPDNIAMVYHDLRLTYKQVDEQSERIAQYVQSLGLGNEDVVSVLIPRSEWMVIASLGVLKAGCAYQPLDPSYPAERLNFMMQDASAKLLISDEELRPIVNDYQGKVLLTKDIAALPAAETPVVADIKPSSLFILLYTSGSTGTPKGCQLEHGNLVAFCHWYHRYYDLKPEHKVAAYASYGFDACMMDMYSALTCGAAVYIIGEDIRLNLPDLNDYFNREGITHSFMTTQVGCQFAMNFDNHSLLHLSVGGEKVLPLTPPTNYQLHNGYGPTECTIFTTTYPMKEFEQNAPIGKPLDNIRLYIVDKQLNRLPIGAVGELWVSGPQVSRGYLNRPDKTAEVYLPNPFISLTTNPQPLTTKYARCYRTGDIVRYLPDGNIQFVGRRDGQVKIRGFRIELKEVEAVIRQYPGIKDATVQAFDYENGGKFIAAYIVSDQQVDIKELNSFIAQQKPPYMVPAATMQIDAIPLNQNQKVNRKALPAPVIQVADREYVEPKNDQERLFAKIFGDVLTMDKISATDNFFELGGSSLMVTRVIIEADKAGVHVAYGDVFANPTPQLLANFINGGATASDGAQSGNDEVSGFDYTAINNMLQRNTLRAFQKGERQKLGNVLLTGPTGYLGIHVLRELIDSDAENIYCMVRGETTEAAESRLRTLLYYYFANAFKDLFGKRLHIVLGDVTKDFSNFLPPTLNHSIDTVFNCAANVKHFSKGTDIEDVNIGGAKYCVDFCLKTGARLVHVSTTSVGGLSVNGVPAPDVVLTEQNLYFGQTLSNQYIYSKFMADRIILDAVALHGLNAKVMRVGNLAARSTDGEFQVNFQSNSYMGRIKVYNMLGCCPYAMYDAPAEFSPINETARAIVLLASTPKDCTVFHPYNNHIQLMGDILTQLGDITGGVRFVESDEFEAVMAEAQNDPQKAKQLSALLAYKDMAHGQKSASVGRRNSYTSQVLHRLGFYWSTTSWDYDQQMLQAIAGFGFFD
ncbi:MAG: amino acid adenylation domain-containing protein [Prevotella sp.]|nr:amino acid adenylation domain-containing protein [Prevotella sp.]